MRKVAALLAVMAATGLLWWIVGGGGPDGLEPGEGVDTNGGTAEPDALAPLASATATSTTTSTGAGGTAPESAPGPASAGTAGAGASGVVELDGFVTDEELAFLGGAEVTFARKGLPSIAMVADEDGYFDAGVIQAGDWAVTVEVKNQPPWNDVVTIAGEAQTMMLTIQPRLVIELEIPDCADEAPYRVGVAYRTADKVERSPRPSRVTPLGDRVWRLRLEGRDEIPGPHGIRVWVVGTDHATGCSDWITARSGTLRVRIDLEPAVTIRGAVVDASGEPVPNATVLRMASGGMPQPIYIGLLDGLFDHGGVAAGPDGRFALAHPAAGHWTLGAHAGEGPNARRGFARVHAVRGAQPITIVVQGDATGVKFRLLDRGGTPIPEMEFTLEGPHGVPGLFDNAAGGDYTDEGGRVVLDDELRPGRYKCVLDDGRWGWVEFEAGRGAEVTARIDRESERRPLRVRVTRDGAPQPGVWLGITPWGVTDGGGHGETDATGHVTVRTRPASRYLVDLPPPKGLKDAWRAFQWVDHPLGSGTLELEYRAGHSLEVEVLDAGGRPFTKYTGGLVLDVPQRGDDYAVELRSNRTQSHRTTFRGLPECRCWLFVDTITWSGMGHRFGPFTILPGANKVSVQVQPFGELRGRVVDAAGRPLHGVGVVAGHMGWGRTPRGQSMATTSADGLFRFPKMWAGPIEVRIHKQTVTEDGEQLLHRARADVPAGGTAYQVITVR